MDEDLHNKRRFNALMRRLEDAAPAAVGRLLEEGCEPDALWSFAQPLNELVGPGAVAEGFFRPLRNALPDLERHDDLLFAGTCARTTWVAAMGHYLGTFSAPLFGVPPTGGVARLRFGAIHAIRGGRIGRSYVLFDLLDLMRQAGIWFLPPSLGEEGYFPGPATQDGVLLTARDEGEGRRTIELARAMARGLMDFDGRTLESMAQERFWHPKMMWYGPSGIGTTRRLRGFQDFHQRPFLTAFPDRAGVGHAAEFGDGAYAGWVGWPSLRATHTGGGWLGLPPTGRQVTMRVMDFYRREGDLLRENWVFIDLLDVMMQLGLDPFDRLAFEARRRR